MSYPEKPSFEGVLLFIGIVVVGILYLIVSYNDCEGRRGVLVEGALGEYECVPEK